MPPAERAQTFASAPIGDLLAVLLRQMKRPLSAHGVSLSDEQARHRVAARLAGDAVPGVDALADALRAVRAESAQVLAGMRLTFAAALDTPMDRLPGWETTAEFLALAEQKSNAELRISLAAALLLAFTGGDPSALDALWTLVDGDYGDESVIARRVLCFAAGVDADAGDWRAGVAGRFPRA